MIYSDSSYSASPYSSGSAGLGLSVGNAIGTSVATARAGVIARSTGVAGVTGRQGFRFTSSGSATVLSLSGSKFSAAGVATTSIRVGVRALASGIATPLARAGMIARSSGIATTNVDGSAGVIATSAGSATILGRAGSKYSVAGSAAVLARAGSKYTVAGSAAVLARVGFRYSSTGVGFAAGVGAGGVIFTSQGSADVLGIPGSTASSAGSATVTAGVAIGVPFQANGQASTNFIGLYRVGVIPLAAAKSGFSSVGRVVATTPPRPIFKKFYKGFSTRSYEDQGGTFGIYNVQVVEEDLLNEILTLRGDRLRMVDSFGTRIPIAEFELLDENLIRTIREDLTQVFNRDPRVQLLNLDVLPSPNKHALVAVAKLRYIEFNVTKDLQIEITSR